MKNKKSIIIFAVLLICAICMVVGTSIYKRKLNTPQPQEVEEQTEEKTPDASIELKDEKEEVVITPENQKDAEEGIEGNGTSSDAEVETPWDIALINQQLAEAGEAYETMYLTMYVLEETNLLKDADEASEKLKKLRKAQAVQVYAVDDTRTYALALVDGTEGYVKAEYLTNVKRLAELDDTAETLASNKKKVEEIALSKEEVEEAKKEATKLETNQKTPANQNTGSEAAETPQQTPETQQSTPAAVPGAVTPEELFAEWGTTEDINWEATYEREELMSHEEIEEWLQRNGINDENVEWQ